MSIPIFNVNTLFLVLFLSLLFSFSLTLAKVIFGIVSANFDESRDTKKHLNKIQRTANSMRFFETVSIGRIVCNAISSIFAFLILYNFFPQITPFLWANFLIKIILIGVIIYSTAIFIPTLIGNLRPYSLARITLILFKISSFPFKHLAILVRKFSDLLLKIMGYDHRLSFLTEDQREMLASDTTAEEDNLLEDEEKQMILNIFDFAETPVREIMTPRVDMFSLESNTPLETVTKVLNHERHSRIPVFKKSIDNIVGVLHNRDFLHWFTENHQDSFKLESIVKPAMFVPYNKKIDDLLKDFRRTGNQIAIVIDEYGGTAGLVTMEDILEEIVGDIRDEDDLDEELQIKRLKDGKFIINPLITLGDLEDELGIALKAPEDSHVETLSGLIHSTLESLPAPGTELNLGVCKVKILKIEGTRMGKILLTLPPK